uniref:SWIM-type domain-containing protein n=1 Tax=Tanacetum cinerariifolium TaxID=118510 RepID=A0A699H6Q2_TANCI|nr:hypothetical protein [Tanacetum cinerariifolium]
MVKLSLDLNEPKDSLKTDKAAQNGRTLRSLTLELHHGGWFTPTPSRFYIGGQISSVNVVDIDEFYLHDLKDMVVKLGSGVKDLMYCHFLIPNLGLDYGLHSLNVDADVLEMSKYVKDYKIILVYVEHGSSNVDTSMFDSSPDSNRNVKKKSVVGPFDGLDEILGDYANTGKQITRDESTWKQMLVYVEGNDTSGSDSEDLDYDPKHDDVFDDDEHTVEEVHVNMNNFSFIADPKHDTSICVVDVQEDDLDIIDYDSFGSDLDDGINSKRRIQLRELKRISKQKNKGLNKYYFYLRHQFANKEIMKGRVKKHSVETRRQIILVKVIMKRYCVRHIHENMKSQFKGGVYKEMLWNAPKATSKGKFKKKMGELKSFNSDAYDWLVKIPLEQWSKAYFLEYLMKRIVVVQKVIAKTVGPLTPSMTKMFDDIKKATEYNVQWNGGFLYQVTGPYKDQCVVNMDRRVCSCRKWELTGIPCKHIMAAIYNMFENSMGVVESKTVIIPPLYKPLVGRPPKKRKKSNDEIASQIASSGKLSKKGKSVSSQAAGSRKVFSQAAGARNISCQAAGARKPSSQPSAAQSTANQRPRQGFQGLIAGPSSRSKRKTKKLVDV